MQYPLFSGLALALFFLFPLRENTTAHPPPRPEPWQQEMLDRVNELRAEGCHCGGTYLPPVPPLRWNGRLAKAAQKHADDMNRNRFMGHRGSDGSRVAQRAERAGYQWRAIAENVAWNTPNVEQTIRIWRNSPSHCHIMLGSDYREMGAAQAGPYWAQVFGWKMQ